MRRSLREVRKLLAEVRPTGSDALSPQEFYDLIEEMGRAEGRDKIIERVLADQAEFTEDILTVRAHVA